MYKSIIESISAMKKSDILIVSYRDFEFKIYRCGPISNSKSRLKGTPHYIIYAAGTPICVGCSGTPDGCYNLIEAYVVSGGCK